MAPTTADSASCNGHDLSENNNVPPKVSIHVADVLCTPLFDPHPNMRSSTHIDLERLLSEEGRARKQGTLRSLVGQFVGRSDIISLSGGLPPASTLPFKSFTAELHDGTVVEVHGDTALSAQQYNTSLRGFPPLLEWAQQHVADVHAPPASGGHSTAITNGGNHTLEIITSLILDRGDSFLVEEYTYPVVLESIADAKGLHALGIPIDRDGLIPEELEALLTQLSRNTKRFPKLLYTVPTGQNPTGAMTSFKRKQKIYRLCQQFDILIVEDDPYYFVQHGMDPRGLESLPKKSSYLSLDVDGRVLRIDSFAKCLAPGLRLGWVTAAEEFVERIVATLHAHTVGPCGLSQVLLSSTLEAWGRKGFHAHLADLQMEYTRRAAAADAAARKYLSGVAEWDFPRGGMFLWVKLLGIDDVSEIWTALMGHGVVVLPGKAAHWRRNDESFRCPYIRISFSQASDEDMCQGMKRIADVLHSLSTE